MNTQTRLVDLGLYQLMGETYKIYIQKMIMQYGEGGEERYAEPCFKALSHGFCKVTAVLLTSAKTKELPNVI